MSSKRKPPIDRENAEDVDVVVPIPVDTPPDPTCALTPQTNITVKEMFEINTALVFRLLGLNTSEKGSLSQLVLPKSAVDQLSDKAARHFTEVPAE